ncbi:MAG TPA: response regulator [Phycisphaerales bacterium]|nr:response regulator [Phycisphaerales bacterium]
MDQHQTPIPEFPFEGSGAARQGRLMRRWFILCRVAACASILAGLVSLVGWALGMEVLYRAGRTGPAMNPVIAVALLLLGASLLSICRARPKRWTTWTARFGGAFLLLVGAARLVGFVTPTSWGVGPIIDGFLFARGVEAAASSPHGAAMIGPATALELALAGMVVVLLALRMRKWDSLISLPSLGLAVVPSLVLVGHANGVASLSGLGEHSPMALHTAIALLAASVGLLCADCGLYWARRCAEDPDGDDWSGYSMERKVTVGFAAALMVMTLVGLASFKALEQFRDEARGDNRTRENLARLADVGALLVEAEAAARGYVLSGNADCLTRYSAAASAVGPGVQQLRTLLSGSPPHDARLGDLSLLVGRKLQMLRRAIDLRAEGNLGEASRLAMNTEGENISEGIRRDLNTMAAIEREALGKRIAAVGASATATIATIAVGSLIGLLLVGAAGWLIHRDIAARQVSQRELAEAKRSAEAASRAKSEFLAHMSHEIRTPLNGVLGMTDLLLGTELAEQQRRYGQLAKSSAESLTTVINDILDFSKIEAGKLEIVSYDFNLHGAVGDVMDVMSQNARRKGLELVCHIDQAVPSLVCGDSARMRQILINLVNNAIKFTREGGVIVRLTVDHEEGEKATIRFAITDTGIGIPKDRIDRLFKAFSQADASTTRVYGGTGLGLVIAKQLAGLLGGTVGVESEEGKGSTFWFTACFELRENSDVAQARRREHLWGAEFIRRDPREMRVLVVHENDLQRDALREQIETWGLVASTSSDAEHALLSLAQASADKAPYQVAIVDSVLSGLDVGEFARRVRKDPETKATVLMLMLSVDAEVDRDHLRASGFTGYITKPVRQTDLFKSIMDAMTVAKQEAAADAPPGPIPMSAYFPARSTDGGAPRILLAEDNEVNRIVATEILKKSGYRFETAVNGAKAVEAVKKEFFDVVLMDCQMPVMDGFEATREIRRWEAAGPEIGGYRRAIPIIALTANAMKGDRERCLEAGMDAYTAKPIDPKHLLSTIVAQLKRDAIAQQQQAA